MKRSLSFGPAREIALIVAGTCLIAGTYGLVRLSYGLFLPDIQASVPMSTSVAGYISSGASIAYCLGAVAGLVAADRPRLLVAGAIATASIGSVGIAIASSTPILASATVLASAGAGLASPGLVAVVGRNLPAARVPRGQATVNAGTGPGLVAAGLLALLLPQWRLGFTISAVVTAAAGLCVLLLDRATGDLAAPAAAPNDGPGLRWMAALVRPAAAALLLGAASAAVWTYGRAHLVAAGVGDSASVLAWIALGVGGAVTVLTAGALSAIAAPRAWLLTASAVAAATAALALVPGRLPLALLACGVFGWGFVASTSALIAWTGWLLPRRAAAGTSILFIALVLGQAAGSSAAGALSDLVGLPTTFLLAAGATVLAGGCAGRQALTWSPPAPADGPPRHRQRAPREQPG